MAKGAIVSGVQTGLSRGDDPPRTPRPARPMAKGAVVSGVQTGLSRGDAPPYPPGPRARMSAPVTFSPVTSSCHGRTVCCPLARPFAVRLRAGERG